MATTRRRKRRKRRGRRIVLTMLTFLIVVGAIIASITVFLKVADIEVKGLTKYEATDVVATSGIEVGDNMFAINKFDVAEQILNQYPYIETIKIRRKLPDTFVFEITERVPAAFVEAEGKRWLLDSSAYVLEMLPENELLSVSKIKGGTVIVPQPGKELVFEKSEQLEALKKVLDAVENAEIADKIRRIEIEKFYDIKIVYEDRFLISLGDSDNLPRKIEMIKAVIAELSDYERGTLNVSAVKKTVFLPDMGIDLSDGETVLPEESENESTTEVPQEENGSVSSDTSEDTQASGESSETSSLGEG